MRCIALAIVDNVQALHARSDPATTRAGLASHRGRRLPRRVRLAVLGVLRPGAAVCAARW